MARNAAWLAVLACAIAAVVFASRFGSDPGLSASPLIGQPLPSIDVLTLGTGDSVDLATVDGDVVVLNFFASWCLECRKEHNDLVATAAAFDDRNVRFVGIAFQDRPADIAEFLTELGQSPETLYVIDADSEAAIALGVRGVPETFFVDDAGIIQGRIQGESNALLLARTIDAMLAGETPGAQVVGGVQSRPE